MSEIIKYEAVLSPWQPEIKRREFASETERFLVDRHGRRQAKESSHSIFYSTWEQARDALIALHEQRVMQARRDLELANSRLGNVKGWRPLP